MRNLTPEECEFIAGGRKMRLASTTYDPETIVVTGSPPPPPPPPYYPPPPPPPPPDPAPPPPGGGGGGGGAAGSYTADNYTTDSKCSDGAAVGIAGEMKNLLATPNGNAEYGAYITKNSDGSYGAYQDEIQTSYMPTYVNMGALPSTSDLSHMTGFINCVTWNSSDYNANFIARYPDAGDWYALDQMAAAGANPANLSLYLLDGFGDVHEYHYADKDALNNLTDSQRMNGVMLGAAPQPCG